MAEKDKPQKGGKPAAAAGQPQGKGGAKGGQQQAKGGGRQGKPAGKGEAAAARKPRPKDYRPRLKDHYDKVVRGQLTEKFGYKKISKQELVDARVKSFDAADANRDKVLDPLEQQKFAALVTVKRDSIEKSTSPGVRKTKKPSRIRSAPSTRFKATLTTAARVFGMTA